MRELDFPSSDGNKNERKNENEKFEESDIEEHRKTGEQFVGNSCVLNLPFFKKENKNKNTNRKFMVKVEDSRL